MLILGGTSEALALARGLSGNRHFETIYSIAGRTKTPNLPPGKVRSGGFGGVDGLCGFLKDQHIDLLVDATHPYAARISANAVQAARVLGTTMLALRRPAWRPEPGDHWREVVDMTAAAAALGDATRRVFLTIGALELAPFKPCPNFFLIRSVDEIPAPLLPGNHHAITARGPFALEDEHALLETHAIDVLVTKNSGGPATYPKLMAARETGIEVIMIKRPRLPDVSHKVCDVEAALRWLEAHHAGTAATERGV